MAACVWVGRARGKERMRKTVDALLQRSRTIFCTRVDSLSHSLVSSGPHITLDNACSVALSGYSESIVDQNDIILSTGTRSGRGSAEPTRPLPVVGRGINPHG